MLMISKRPPPDRLILHIFTPFYMNPNYTFFYIFFRNHKMNFRKKYNSENVKWISDSQLISETQVWNRKREMNFSNTSCKSENMICISKDIEMKWISKGENDFQVTINWFSFDSSVAYDVIFAFETFELFTKKCQHWVCKKRKKMTPKANKDIKY